MRPAAGRGRAHLPRLPLLPPPKPLRPWTRRQRQAPGLLSRQPQRVGCRRPRRSELQAQGERCQRRERSRLSRSVLQAQEEQRQRRLRSRPHRSVQQAQEERRQRKERSRPHRRVQQAQEGQRQRRERSRPHRSVQQAREGQRQRKERSRLRRNVQQAQEERRQRRERSRPHRSVQQAQEERRQRKERSRPHRSVQQAQEERRQRKERSRPRWSVQQAQEERRQPVPPAAVHRASNELLWSEFFDDDKQSTPSEKFWDLNGKTVQIKGFMGEVLSFDKHWFLLIPQPGAECPFDNGDETYWNKIMIVYVPKDVKLRYTQGPLQITARLDVGIKIDESGYKTMFRLYDAKFERLTE
ncbi:hypothetical protein ACHHV8_27565 [Paenibacillus sp. TAB 01]|uniref:hypothetical protein n=1 Tax=Paenibacillus sp. TAB 01 TaxID=3368988 RepID=UPI003750E87E